MTSIDEFTVEVRRAGTLLSPPERYATLFDATRAALDIVERLGQAPPGTALVVAIRRDATSFLEIKVVPGTALDR